MTDKAIDLLNEKAIRRFEQAKSKASSLSFDELSVIDISRDLYDKLYDDNQKVLLELAKEQYEETEPNGHKPPGKKWILALFLAYDQVTRYVYENEVDRKRERLVEAVNSGGDKATQFRKGLSYWSQMTAQYAETVTDKAALKAYEDAGIKKVRWVAEMDGKECPICHARNGKIYPIKSLPPKPHWRCRCQFEPVGKPE